LLVRDGRALIFNRVAKTGSQSITQLLTKLEKRHDFQSQIIIESNVERLFEAPKILADFVAVVDRKSLTGSFAFVKHVNFVDFDKYGAQWSPLYLNMVRHPVERVRRSEWKKSE